MLCDAESLKSENILFIHLFLFIRINLSNRFFFCPSKILFEIDRGNHEKENSLCCFLEMLNF